MSAPRGKNMALQRFGAVRDLFQRNFFCKDVFHFFFARTKTKTRQITGTKIIFKPLFSNKLIIFDFLTSTHFFIKRFVLNN